MRCLMMLSLVWCLTVCGCGKKKADPDTNNPTNTNSGSGNANNGSGNTNSGGNGGSANPQQTISDVDAQLVDYQKVKDDPNIVVIENKAKGQDPISFAASAYVSLSTKAQALAFQHQLKLMQAANGTWPTFQEFQQTAKQMRVEFNRMKPYQMYGYDPKTGEIMILEDQQKKKQIYEEKGIPLDE